jgi:two-component system LytT family response regulator
MAKPLPKSSFPMKTKITAVIVDDELLSIDVIEAYLKTFLEIELIGKFSRSSEAAEKIPLLKPHLLFLDIQMPVMDGFELIEAIISETNPYIIFTTAFDQYALKAFEVNAIGYLLKPFEREKFNQAVNKFLSQHAEKANDDLYDGILKMLQERPASTFLKRIMVKDARKIFYIPVNEIVHFEASGDYVKAVTEKNAHLVNYTMAQLENQLPPKDFIRIHRSHIINVKHVREFVPYFNGEYQIAMANNDTVKMSRNYKDNVKKIFPDL